jgi:hypothetical protein
MLARLGIRRKLGLLLAIPLVAVVLVMVRIRGASTCQGRRGRHRYRQCRAPDRWLDRSCGRAAALGPFAARAGRGRCSRGVRVGSQIANLRDDQPP